MCAAGPRGEHKAVPPYTFVCFESIKDVSEYFFSSRAFFFCLLFPFLFLRILLGREQLCSLTDRLFGVIHKLSIVMDWGQCGP